MLIDKRLTHTKRHTSLRLERLEPRLVLSSTPLVTEFMASNCGTIADGDSAFSDWIEVHNPTAAAINLAGWHLTDDSANLGKWAFPSLSQSVLDPGEYLVIFASGQPTDDYVDPAGNLHTNFNLAAGGEYLALTDDTESIIQEFTPQYPSQETDISYGLGVTQQDVLVSVGAAADILVPTTAGQLDANWATEGFVPSGNWFSGETGLGYDIESSATVIASYNASLGGAGVAPDPTTQGWSPDQTGGPPNQQVFDASPDLGIDAWAISDLGGGGKVEYEYFLSDQQIAAGNANGWSLTSTSRTIDGEFDVLVYRDGVRQYVVWKAINANGDLEVNVVGNGFYTLTTGGTGSDAYHDHDLTYDPDTGLVTYWFDGSEIASTSGTPHSAKQILWGSGSTGGRGIANYHQVQLSIGSLGDFTPHIETDLISQMSGVNSSAFVRLPFSVTDPSDYDTLTLDLQYDDGFIAYLNGTLVTSTNAPASPVFNSASTAVRDDAEAVQFESFDLSAHLGLLQPGSNVLAIQALNLSAGDDDLLLTPRLTAFDSTSENSLYFTNPTPGAANGTGFVGFVDDTTFSIDRGFFDAPFNVEIASATAGAAIYYTTDGSAPSEANGTLYTGPINIAQTTPLRAMATLAGYLPTNIDTHSYLFLSDVITEDGSGLPLPPFPGTSNWDYEMDPSIVNDPRFASLQSDLKALPTLSLVLDADDAWGTDGFYATLEESQAAERPVSVELIGTDGVGQFQEDAGIRVFGSGSLNRALGKKSMRLVFRSNFGPTKLDFPFFGPDRADELDTISLRGNYFDTWTFQSDGGSLGGGCCGRSRSTYLRDQFAHESHAAMGAHTIAGSFVHLYINGIYWGLYNPTERPDEEFMQSYFGGADTDYDVIKTGVSIVSGDLTGWNEMLTIARGNGPNGNLSSNAAYDDLQQYLAIDDFIDYMLVNFYGGNHDWPHNNWYVARNRTLGEPFRFYEWDAENFLFSVNSNRTGVSNSNTAGELYDLLRQNDEFNLRFADRVQTHMFNSGALTVTESTARFQNIVNTIRPALNAESARWGDELQEPAHNTIDDFDAVVAEKLNNYFPFRTGIVLSQLRSAGLYPNTDAPSFNQHGGQVASGFDLTISAPSGTLYYTLDGTDPRISGGAINPAAIEYTGTPVDITAATTVQARVLNGGTWSAVNEASFTVLPPADTSNLRIAELHYHPADSTAAEINAGFSDSDEFEFIELVNIAAGPIELQLTSLSGGVNFTVAAPTALAPGERVVVVENTAAFQLRYGSSIRIIGQWTGGLDNGGETLTLSDQAGKVVQSFTYEDGDDPGEEAWPSAPDGTGPSLVILNSEGDYNDGTNWVASNTTHGTPGAEEVIFSGDYNTDGIVDAADYTVWRDAIGQSVTPFSAADGDGNGVIDQGDYDVWRSTYGQTIPLPAFDYGSKHIEEENTVSSARDALFAGQTTAAIDERDQSLDDGVIERLFTPHLTEFASILPALLEPTSPLDISLQSERTATVDAALARLRWTAYFSSLDRDSNNTPLMKLDAAQVQQKADGDEGLPSYRVRLLPLSNWYGSPNADGT